MPDRPLRGIPAATVTTDRHRGTIVLYANSDDGSVLILNCMGGDRGCQDRLLRNSAGRGAELLNLDLLAFIRWAGAHSVPHIDMTVGDWGELRAIDQA